MHGFHLNRNTVHERKSVVVPTLMCQPEARVHTTEHVAFVDAFGEKKWLWHVRVAVATGVQQVQRGLVACVPVQNDPRLTGVKPLYMPRTR